MFERYTDRARRVITLAMQAESDMGHREADTGHLLAGLIGEGGGVAWQALTALGVTPEMVREAVWSRHPGGTAQPVAFLVASYGLKRALEMALRESMLRGDNFIGTEHLLLGLIREGRDVGALALADCGIANGDRGFLEDARRKVLELLDGHERHPAKPPAPVLEPEDGEPAPDLTEVPWRAGRKNPRNMYAVTGDDWEAHPDIGKLDTAELAAEACRSHNEALARRTDE